MKEKNNSKKLLIGILVIVLIVTITFTLNSIINNEKSNISGSAVLNIGNLAELKIKVSIPCPGHAAIIKGEVLKSAGISSVGFNFPNVFTIKYDSKEISEQDILNLDIFKEYPAKKV